MEKVKRRKFKKEFKRWKGKLAFYFIYMALGNRSSKIKCSM